VCRRVGRFVRLVWLGINMRLAYLSWFSMFVVCAVWNSSDQKQWIEYWYDAYARVEDVNYPDGGNIHYAYDGFGRRVQVTDNRNAADNIGGTGTISYEYDALDRVLKVTDQDGWIVEYGYMSDGQKSQVKVIEPSNDQVMYYVANLYDKAPPAVRQRAVAWPDNAVGAKLGYDDGGVQQSSP